MLKNERTFLIEVPEIVSQSRPRFAVKGKMVWVYYGERTKRQRKLLADTFRAKYPDVQVDDKAQFYLFVIVTRGKSKKRVDLDNIFKIIMDTFTGIIWQDDSQVHLVVGGFEDSEENQPATTIMIIKKENE